MTERADWESAPSWELHAAEFAAWAGSYTGPRFHACLCDPPYGIAFMGNGWDDPGGPEAFQRQAREWGRALRPLLRPGALVLMFAGTRMWHRLACGMEDAGFRLWDTLMWITGQGFPKAQRICCDCNKTQPMEQSGGSNDLPLRDEIQTCTVAAEADTPPALQPKMRPPLSSSVHTTDDEDYCKAREARLDRNQPSPLPTKDGRPQQSGVEGRSDPQTPEGKLQGREIRPVPAGIPSDGEEGRVCDGAPPCYGEETRAPAAADGSSPPPRPQPVAQRGEQPATVSLKRGAQKGGGRCKKCGKVLDQSWSGHKTPQLKPAWEPVLCFRAPDGGRTYAELATGFGSGALNVEDTRIGTDTVGWSGGAAGGNTWNENNCGLSKPGKARPVSGRYPANLALECMCERTELVKASDGVRHTDPGCPAFLLDAQAGEGPTKRVETPSPAAEDHGATGEWGSLHGARGPRGYDGTGGPSRFFYCAKASRSEREAGLREAGLREAGLREAEGGVGALRDGGRLGTKVCNNHPTVKPIDINRWLATLLLPPAAVGTRRILVPFAGVGSEMVGCLLAGWDEVVGVEMDPGYAGIARVRIAHWIGEA